MTDLVVPATPQVPALVHATPHLDLDANDIGLPRIKVAQAMTKQTQEELVSPGQIFSSFSEDDADVLYDGEGDGVLAHVIGLTKGKSLSVEGDLQTWAFNDPDAPAEAWVTYNYVLCLPEVDVDVPYKFLVTKSGRNAARAWNLLLKKAEATGPSYRIAVRLTTTKKKNDKGTWFVVNVRPAEATEAGITAAAKLAAMITDALPNEAVPQTAADAPSI